MTMKTGTVTPRPGKLKLALVLAALMTVSQASCLAKFTTPGGLRPVYKPMEGKKYETVGTARGESSSFRFLWLLPFTPGHSLEEALDQAMHEKGADNIIRVRWEVERQIWILGLVTVIHVDGTAVRYLDDEGK